MALSTTRPSLATPLLLGAALLIAAPGAARAQAATQRGPAPASYTEAQAQQGAQLFEESCQNCHGADLSGGEGPPLVGQQFIYTWDGNPVSGLVRFVERNMPMNAPGTLSAESAAAAVAYILSRNRVAAGSTPLTATSQAAVIIPPPDRRR